MLENSLKTWEQHVTSFRRPFPKYTSPVPLYTWHFTNFLFFFWMFKPFEGILARKIANHQNHEKNIFGEIAVKSTTRRYDAWGEPTKFLAQTHTLSKRFAHFSAINFSSTDNFRSEKNIENHEND